MPSGALLYYRDSLAILYAEVKEMAKRIWILALCVVIAGVIVAIALAEKPQTDEQTPESTAAPENAQKLSFGFGLQSTGRVGPGQDETGTPVYSINQPFAAALFDEEGHIRYLYVDQLEAATPNYDGAGMPRFSGFPGQRYNLDEKHDGKIAGQLVVTETSLVDEVGAWQTKRARGESYQLTSGTWSAQMDAYQKLFVGKTVAELEDWFARFTSEANGRPLKPDAANEQDKAKYDALSDEEKTALADVTSGATMSLNDAHGDILGAIRAAYDARKEVGGDVQSVGLVLSPGAAKNGDAYTLNEVFAAACFDGEGRVVASHIDQMEVVSDNASGDAPRFSGYPGQMPQAEGTGEITDDSFLAQIASWQTKRQRGAAYRMPAGTWGDQMDAYQQLFLGKTLPEIKDWFDAFCGAEGKPLKPDMQGADQEKYTALSEKEKSALADVTSSASMSLKSAQNDLLGALQKAYDERMPIK